MVIKSKRAAAGSQYAILVGLIAVLGIAAIGTTGTAFRGLMLNTANMIGGQGRNVVFSAPPPAPDSTPDAFSFADQPAVAPSSIISSNAVAVSGFDGLLTAVCGSGCTDIARNGSWAGATTLAGFQPGDNLAIRQQSAASFGTPTTATVALGNTNSGLWTVTTSNQDITPDAFAFVNQTGANPNTQTDSNTVTVTGFDGPLTATCGTGCTDIARNGNWAGNTSLGGFQSGDSIAIRQVTASTFNSAATASVALGNTTSGTWSVTTRAQNTTPAAFAFTDQTGVATSTLISSNFVAVTGFDAPLTASCTGNCSEIGRNGSWSGTNSVANFAPGDTIAIRMTSAATGSTAKTATVTLGGRTSGTWTVTTATAPAAGNCSPGSFNATYGKCVFAGSGSWTVPTGVTAINIKMWGGGGGGGTNTWPGGAGGAGGYASATLSVTPGATVTIYVGAGGTGGQSLSYAGGGGGGASAVVYSGLVRLVAGGGGGGGSFTIGGGGGGGTTGQTGPTNTATSTENGGGGGSQSAAGGGGTGTRRNGNSGSGSNGGNGVAANSSNAPGGGGYGTGGYGAAYSGDGGSGGGGGGYFGGGSGGGGGLGAGGGGGSGFCGNGGVSACVNTQANLTTPANNGDAERGTAGNAGSTNANGSAGAVLISW